MIRRLFFLQLVFAISLAGPVLFLSDTVIEAQVNEFWTERSLLSQGVLNDPDIFGQMAFPILAPDPWGHVHAVWVVQAHERTGSIGETLFYSRWDGSAWSKPMDILYLQGDIIAGIQLAADSQGGLRLIGTMNNVGSMWFSRARIEDAGSSHGWSTPSPVVTDSVTGLHMAQDTDDQLHIVYCAVDGDQGIYHVSSEDGQTWSTPTRIGGSPEISYRSCYSRLAIDQKGILHVVWGQAGLESTVLYYSRSESNGESWQSPVEIDRKDDRYWEAYGPTLANIIAVGADDIHMVWDGPPAGQRWHRWSDDGGNTWRSARQIDPSLRGITDVATMAADSSGTIHLVSQGLEFTGPFHAFWRGGNWSPFRLIDELGGADAEQRANLVLARGNVLHVAWDSKSFEEIWTSRMKLNVPEIVPLPLPTSLPTPTSQVPEVTSTVTEPAASVDSTTSEVAIDSEELAAPVYEEVPGSLILLASTLPVFVLVGATILFRWTRSRR